MKSVATQVDPGMMCVACNKRALSLDHDYCVAIPCEQNSILRPPSPLIPAVVAPAACMEPRTTPSTCMEPRTKQKKVEIDTASVDDAVVEATYCNSPDRTKKYIVFDEELNELFKFCPQCGLCVTKLVKKIHGSSLSIEYTCLRAHCNTWTSQPKVRGKMSAGNLLMSSAIVLSGSSYTKVASLFEILNIPFPSNTTFNVIQAAYIQPVINDYWSMHQSTVLSVLSEGPLRLCGDGRSDSPGFSAKYGSYVLMDMATELIVDQQLVTVTETGKSNSVGMELLGFQRSLQFITDHGVTVTTVATDRHIGIRCYLRDNFPGIDHQFDVWHLAKSIVKKLTKRAQKKECADLLPWIQSISNHLYYCAQSCGGDAGMLIAKWLSLIHHIANIHAWNGETSTMCEHGDLDESETAWLAVDSPAHLAVKDVIANKKLLADIKRLSQFCHTGNLENYNSVVLKYAPKRQHFHYRGMQARLQLAALDHNHNIGRAAAKDKSGKDVVRQIYSKARKTWVLRNEYVSKSYMFRQQLLHYIYLRRMDNRSKMTSSTNTVVIPPLPSNIAIKDKPTRDEAISGLISRHLK